MIELAIALPVLVILVVGMIEFGFGFLDFQVVTGATREGARVGASAGADPIADDLIVAAVDEALGGLGNDSVAREIWIYKSDSSGSIVDEVNLTNKYTPNGSGGWDCQAPCPWPPAVRVTTLDPSLTVIQRDYLGVRVVFDHAWVVGLFPFSPPTWVDDTVMQLEPEFES